MQILIAFVVMGLIGVFAVVLAASAALVQCLPLVIVVLAVVGAVRWWERRSHPRNPPGRRHRRACPPSRDRHRRPGPRCRGPTGGWWCRCGWTDAGECGAVRSLTPR